MSAPAMRRGSMRFSARNLHCMLSQGNVHSIAPTSQFGSQLFARRAIIRDHS